MWSDIIGQYVSLPCFTDKVGKHCKIKTLHTFSTTWNHLWILQIIVLTWPPPMNNLLQLQSQLLVKQVFLVFFFPQTIPISSQIFPIRLKVIVRNWPLITLTWSYRDLRVFNRCPHHSISCMVQCLSLSLDMQEWLEVKYRHSC